LGGYRLSDIIWYALGNQIPPVANENINENINENSILDTINI